MVDTTTQIIDFSEIHLWHLDIVFYGKKHGPMA